MNHQYSSYPPDLYTHDVRTGQFRIPPPEPQVTQNPHDWQPAPRTPLKRTRGQKILSFVHALDFILIPGLIAALGSSGVPDTTEPKWVVPLLLMAVLFITMSFFFQSFSSQPLWWKEVGKGIAIAAAVTFVAHSLRVHRRHRDDQIAQAIVRAQDREARRSDFF